MKSEKIDINRKNELFRVNRCNLVIPNNVNGQSAKGAGQASWVQIPFNLFFSYLFHSKKVPPPLLGNSTQVSTKNCSLSLSAVSISVADCGISHHWLRRRRGRGLQGRGLCFFSLMKTWPGEKSQRCK